MELGVGVTTLIAESERSIALRGFVARLLGWGEDRAAVVDQALRSIRWGATFRAGLVLCGEPDLVPIAQALHHRTLGPGRPFVVCDPRRGNTAATVRSPANCEDAMTAFDEARGGSLCVRGVRLPRDFAAVVARARDPNAFVQLIVCTDGAQDAALVAGAPVVMPPLRDRAAELPRIIDEVAAEAMAALGVRGAVFDDADRAWVLAHAATSLAEIEKATLRLVALKATDSMRAAAELLGMAQVSLWTWVERRTPPPGLAR
jgi:hypothetical protein